MENLTELVDDRLHPFKNGIVMDYVDDYDNVCYIQCEFVNGNWAVHTWEFTFNEVL